MNFTLWIEKVTSAYMELVHIRMGNLTSFTRKIFDNLRWKSGLSDAKTTCKNYIEIFNSVYGSL